MISLNYFKKKLSINEKEYSFLPLVDTGVSLMISSLNINLNEFKVIVEEEAIADSDFSESFGSADLRPDASAIPTLSGETHPVVPVRSRPDWKNEQY